MDSPFPKAASSILPSHVGSNKEEKRNECSFVKKAGVRESRGRERKRGGACGPGSTGDIEHIDSGEVVQVGPDEGGTKFWELLRSRLSEKGKDPLLEGPLTDTIVRLLQTMDVT